VYYPGDAYVDINALDLYEHDLGDRYRGNYMAMEQLPDLERLFAHPLIASIEDVDFRRVVPEGPSPAPATEPGAEAAPSKVRVGFVDCSPGYVLGSPDYFETAARAVAEQFRDTVEIVPVRGLYTYRIPNAVDRLIGEENCSIVVFDDHDEYSEYVQDCARRYPEVTFIVPFDEHLNRCPNVRTFGINSEGWYYLTGMAAGAVSETGRIGYVAHSEAQWNVEHATEFTMGVAEVNPDAEVLFTASGGRGAEAVRHLVSQGCDVLNGVANSAEVIRELRSAAERGELICAFSDALPRTVSPEVIAAGLPEDLGEVYSRMLGDILAGRDVDHPYWSDIRSGVVRIDSEDPPFSPRIRGILESAPAPGATAGGPSVYELILSRHRALERGELRVEPERYRGFHPMIRRVSLPD
jgi:simple sugar transport system substrate-binding protein